MTVKEWGALLRRGKASSTELVTDVLARIREQDRFHAFLTVTADEALQAAAEADREMDAGIDRGPFHGVAIGYKDLFCTRGLRTTAGSLLYKDFVPDANAFVVDRLALGGAVSIGKLNLHELAYGATSKNPHYGFVLNPHDTDCVAGGSSGGSAVAVAAGFLPMALGTDTGGSVRIPASYCGVAGFKPTYGCVSRRGVLPLAFSLDHVGPLARNAEDCALAMAEICTLDPLDASSVGYPADEFYQAPPRNLAGLRFGVPRESYFRNIDPEILATIERLLREMERLGAQIVEIQPPGMQDINAAARIIQWSEASALYSTQHDPDRFGADVWALIVQGRQVAAEDYINAQRLRTRYRQAWNEIWRVVDVVVTPTTPTPAPRIDDIEVDIAGYREDVRVASTRLTRSINLTGDPALSLPCGKTHKGLPMGVQFIGPPFGDAKLLAIGQAVERDLLRGD